MKEQETPSLEQIAKMKGERTLSDAELIKGGASYAPTEQDGLVLTEKQKEEIRMEHEGGVYPDAATYVRMNKTIACPTEEVPEEIRKQKGKGWIGNETFYFIDKDGNIAKVDIDYTKISSIVRSNHRSWQDNVAQFTKELVNKGFDVGKITEMPHTAWPAISAYGNMMLLKEKGISKKEFDF